uniref:Uncharacterized protein n=1 Tax=Neolamprologus brichardi TaxID=32507 RepID=A0A3Q4HNW2_NEOBR
MGDVLCEELEDLVHFSVHDLPARGYVVMEEIRRQGKLCDVTLKGTSLRRSCFQFSIIVIATGE